MVKALLESGKLAKPGNSYMMVNPLGSQLQFLRTSTAEFRFQGEVEPGRAPAGEGREVLTLWVDERVRSLSHCGAV
jgi:hypothetical protein